MVENVWVLEWVEGVRKSEGGYREIENLNKLIHSDSRRERDSDLCVHNSHYFTTSNISQNRQHYVTYMEKDLTKCEGNRFWSVSRVVGSALSLGLRF